MNSPSPPSGTTPALQGALLAFQKGQLPLPRETRLTPGTSRAHSRERSPRRLAPQDSGPPRARHDISPSRSHDVSDTAGVGVIAPRRSSPVRTGDSFIAANLAAGPLSPARTGTGGPVDASRSPRADTRPIPSAAKLISMFEGTEERGGVDSRGKTPTSDGGGDGDPVKVDAPPRPTVGAARAGEHAKRAGTPGGKPEAHKASAARRPPVARSKPAVDAALLAARQVARTSAAERAETSPARGPTPPTPPKPRGMGRGDPRAITPLPSPSISATKKDHPVILEPEAGRQRRGSASSEDTFVSASSVQSPAPSPPPSPTRSVRPPRTPTRTSNKSASTSPSRRPAPPPRRNPAGASLNATALSTAIVAGSLASSRLTPSNTGGGDAATTPQKHQPSPRLLQTLRTGDSDHAHRHRDEEEEKTRKNGLRGKRHKHHEGARKRWAARVSEGQRKRYEALWASNRGLFVEEHLSSSSPLGGAGGWARGGVDPGDYVVNVVVRELWRRSRLPDDELEEVWALVDAEGRGVLGRREFVVGTWLVDQRLRGRKIPARVGDSVWDSASDSPQTHGYLRSGNFHLPIFLPPLQPPNPRATGPEPPLSSTPALWNHHSSFPSGSFPTPYADASFVSYYPPPIYPGHFGTFHDATDPISFLPGAPLPSISGLAPFAASGEHRARSLRAGGYFFSLSQGAEIQGQPLESSGRESYLEHLSAVSPPTAALDPTVGGIPPPNPAVTPAASSPSTRRNTYLHGLYPAAADLEPATTSPTITSTRTMSARKRNSTVVDLPSSSPAAQGSKRRRRTSAAAPSRSDPLEAEESDDEDVIDLRDISRVPEMLLKRQREKAERVKLGGFQCAICMDWATSLTVTHCGHLFCADCLTTAMDTEAQRHKCPICRQKIESKPREAYKSSTKGFWPLELKLMTATKKGKRADGQQATVKPGEST
ncbi:uncharacterized protein DNG_05619 [Cephalotrichum gorgonifer]|uniref:RING-type domain-containing protein n=1 Tax=Cephalotrichum gorgonifer TaxID=2041049 RepID=A0AAE8SVM7_9PEZI|nr:uncharacterized protein DNG_05619 [Cephalotrichum gorgonifer]